MHVQKFQIKLSMDKDAHIPERLLKNNPKLYDYVSKRLGDTDSIASGEAKQILIKLANTQAGFNAIFSNAQTNIFENLNGFLKSNSVVRFRVYDVSK